MASKVHLPQLQMSHPEHVRLRVVDNKDYVADESEYLLSPNDSVKIRQPVDWKKYSPQQGFASNLFCAMCKWSCFRSREPRARDIIIGEPEQGTFPPNVIRNQKYGIFTFVPCVLILQFQFFLNFYFLVMALSQFIPIIRIGYIYTYWGPLGFVLFVTLLREAVDDYRRYKRDKEVNNQKYTRLILGSTQVATSSQIKVGDIILIEK
ncbi:unnamed protein product, partial [Darwinula stevensoni]